MRIDIIPHVEFGFKGAGGDRLEKVDPVRGRDWGGLIRHGVIFHCLDSEPYAVMRGESLEEFSTHFVGSPVRNPWKTASSP